MDDRERNILAGLIESDKPFYMAPDRSDVYALAPTSMAPGLLRFENEYTGLTDEEVELLVLNSLICRQWEYIPYTL